MRSEVLVPIEPPAGLWDARDVANYLKASKSWVYQRAEAGLLPCLRIGGLLRFEPDSIRVWAKGSKQGATVVPITRVR